MKARELEEHPKDDEMRILVPRRLRQLVCDEAKVDQRSEAFEARELMYEALVARGKLEAEPKKARSS